MRRTVRILALAWFAGAGTPASAGLFDDEEARKRIEDLRQQMTQQLGEAGKQAEMLSRNQLDFANQLELIKADIARIRGQLEMLTYELESTQKRQKDFYVDLDNRLRKLETPPEAKPEAAPKADPQAETAEYEVAVSALKGGQFKPAAEGFRTFIGKYPNSALLASAHYWGGYAHAQLKDHARAAELFGKFAAGWPADERTPDALESQAASQEVLKDLKGARATLELLAAKYPNSEAAKRARLKLKKK